MLRCHGLIAAAALMVLGTVGLASCGGGGGDGDSSPPPNTGSLTIELPDPFATIFETEDVQGVAFNTNRFTSCDFVGFRAEAKARGLPLPGPTPPGDAAAQRRSPRTVVVLGHHRD